METHSKEILERLTFDDVRRSCFSAMLPRGGHWHALTRTIPDIRGQRRNRHGHRSADGDRYTDHPSGGTQAWKWIR
jgi:hypothetical protein